MWPVVRNYRKPLEGHLPHPCSSFLTTATARKGIGCLACEEAPLSRKPYGGIYLFFPDWYPPFLSNELRGFLRLNDPWFIMWLYLASIFFYLYRVQMALLASKFIFQLPQESQIALKFQASLPLEKPVLIILLLSSLNSIQKQGCCRCQKFL